MQLCNIKKSHIDLFSNMSLTTSNKKIDFFMKILLASLIGAIGLITNSQEGVIGSMLISPLGSPIMALVAALFIFNIKHTLEALMYLFLGFIIMGVSGYIIGYINKDKEPTEEMIKRYTRSTKWTLFNGICVGAVFSIVALSSGSAVIEAVGAGIAISLLPPIVNCGITFANNTLDSKTKKINVINTFMITIINIVGIVIASLVIFAIHCNHKHIFKWE
jgi:uncharacterized hydrophobic protein (TIGR00271 family)